MSLRVPERENSILEEVRSHRVWTTLAEGQSIKVYPFGDEFFIPAIDTGGYETTRWIFLGFGMIPLVAGTLVWIIRTIRRRGRVPAALPS